jgi:hypothetical protein
MQRIKKYGKYVAAAFVCFFLFTRPASAADAVNKVFDNIVHGADQLAVFFTHLT